MRSWLVNIIALMAVFTVTAAAQTSRPTALSTVDSVDLDRYQGKWYEIARYPNRFQTKCSENTTATYSLKSNGRVKVVNQCVTSAGKTIVATGEAKVVNRSGNAKLKVRFAPAFLSFLPMVWGDYWVIDLDPEYRYAVIGEPKRDYFWILSRTPTIADSTYEGILKRAESKGFDRSKIIKTRQATR